MDLRRSLELTHIEDSGQPHCRSRRPLGSRLVCHKRAYLFPLECPEVEAALFCSLKNYILCFLIGVGP